LRPVAVAGAVAFLSVIALLGLRAPAAPAGTPADVSFADGVLSIVGSSSVNDRHALRCREGFVLVGSSQRPDHPVRCTQVRQVVARPLGGNDSVDMTGMTREFGGSGPITVTIRGGAGTDSLMGAPLHRNLLFGDGDSDRVDGGEIGDRVSGGAGSDILSGRAGNDTLSGGTASDLMYGDGGNDSLFGGPGNDALNGGPGRDKLAGGPGRDREAQGYSGGRR
jgi:Ca2+-binding RTX toxin-like protein